MMQAIRVTTHGGPEVLEVVELPIPAPSGNRVVIKHAAIGVNFVDTQHRRGEPYPIGLPLIPGIEAAGTIVACGPEVREYAVGARVGFAGFMSGVYAEYSAVPEDRVVPLPQETSFEDAAATLLQGMTAHALTESVYPVRAGDWVVVHAGASGVGYYLVQLAKRRGGQVIATTSSAEKAAVARAAGADHVLVSSGEQLVAEVAAITGGAGVHAIYDGIGQATFEANLRMVRAQGLIAIYGLSSGNIPPFDINRLSGITGGTARGSLFLTWPTLSDYAARREDLLWRASDVLTWVARGELRPLIGGRFALSQAAEAHRLLETRRAVGKYLLIP